MAPLAGLVAALLVGVTELDVVELLAGVAPELSGAEAELAGWGLSEDCAVAELVVFAISESACFELDVAMSVSALGT